MRYRSIRVKPGDKAHLAQLAQERGCDIVDVLDALVAEAEAGRIYKPLCGRKKGRETVKVTVSMELGKRFGTIRDAWGVYSQQAVTWLLKSADLVKHPDPIDTWARMEKTRKLHEQLWAAAEAQGPQGTNANYPYGLIELDENTFQLEMTDGTYVWPGPIIRRPTT